MEPAQFQDFAEYLPEPTLLVSAAGVVIAANQAVSQLASRPVEVLRNVRLAELVVDPPEKVERFLHLCSRSRQLLPGALCWKSQQTRIDTRCDGAALRPRQGPQEALIFLRCRPRNEAVDQFIVLNQKITALSKEILERKRAEEQRDQLLVSERAARMEAERASRMKDEFLATLSHELRTPLNAILGWTQLLRMGTASPADTTEGLGIIERNCRAQAQLVEDLLDMSRIISGKLRLDVRPVDLVAVIKAAAIIRPAVDARQIRLGTVLDPMAGPVSGDAGRLQQVVWNILSNAAKFTPKGGRIQVVLERVNSHVEIRISDNGEGIKPEFLPHVFERFRQADYSTTRRHGGLGLGLALVRQLVELHGGTVHAASEGEGKGATFTICLPLTIVHPPEGKAARAHPEVPTPGVAPGLSLKGLRVLVVDDEPDARMLVRRLLEGHDAAVRRHRPRRPWSPWRRGRRMCWSAISACRGWMATV